MPYISLNELMPESRWIQITLSKTLDSILNRIYLLTSVFRTNKVKWRHSGVISLNFEHIHSNIHDISLLFLLLTLNMYWPVFLMLTLKK